MLAVELVDAVEAVEAVDAVVEVVLKNGGNKMRVKGPNKKKFEQNNYCFMIGKITVFSGKGNDDSIGLFLLGYFS